MDRRLYSILICLLVLSISTVIPVATYAKTTFSQKTFSAEKSSDKSRQINWTKLKQILKRIINKLRPFVDTDGPTEGGLDDITDWFYFIGFLWSAFPGLCEFIVTIISKLFKIFSGGAELPSDKPVWQLCYEEAHDLVDWDMDER